jgi:two-component system sensor histidine kinase DctS
LICIMPPAPNLAPAASPALTNREGWGWRRALPWIALLILLLVAQSLLLGLTVSHEASRVQEQTEQAAIQVAARLRQLVVHDQVAIQTLGPNRDAQALWEDAPGLVRLEWRDLRKQPLQLELAPRWRLQQRATSAPQLSAETELTCDTALRKRTAELSHSYALTLQNGEILQVMDLCLAQLGAGKPQGYIIATLDLGSLLDISAPAELQATHEFSLSQGEGQSLAQAGNQPGTQVFVALRLVDLPGQSLQLRADSSAGRPGLVPNLSTALVMGLTLALVAMVVLLARDGRRRAGAEAALAESLAFRQAMENALVTGLRARDAEGRVTHVNAAFCQMVGFSAEEVQGAWPPPYWPPECIDDYLKLYEERRALWQPGGHTPPSGQGFETVFMRRSGERFPVLIFEAPMLDAAGRQTGWMSTVLDVTDQRRVEELSRQQQDRLQASARLATVGEMASLLSHELNQPLAAIASYATGSLNLLSDPELASLPDTPEQVQQALERIATQAERAGRVIKSVHDFVRRREHLREAISAEALLESVLPLVRLQARKSGCRVTLDLPPQPLKLHCDRTMVEQILLNLSRNGIQAMEGVTPLEQRELVLRVRPRPGPWVEIAVRDHGPGISPEVAQKLFTPFFTTRSEGMGLGLSLCRTVIEQHGGALDFENCAGGGCEFRFTLPSGAPTT